MTICKNRTVFEMPLNSGECAQKRSHNLGFPGLSMQTSFKRSNFDCGVLYIENPGLAYSIEIRGISDGS